MDNMLLPFRKEDRDESLKLIEKNGFDDLYLSYFRLGDMGNDGVWDNFQIEGSQLDLVFPRRTSCAPLVAYQGPGLIRAGQGQ